MADSLLSTALAQARRWKRRVLLTVGGVVVLAVAVVLIDAWSGLGHSAHGARLERMQRSKQWKDGRFDNPQPLVNDSWGMLTGLLHVSPHATPAVAPETETADPRLFDAWPASGLRVSWFGHASMLIELDGVRVLTDPMWSERSSPLTWAGPKRWFPAPIALRDLPPIDAVVISHDHYDHLDRETIVALNRDTQALFIVPLGVGAHLALLGCARAPIVDLDWWESRKVGEIEVIATPARHASGRHLFDQNAKLWAGYALVGPEHRVYFSGDTGLFPALKQIGEKYGPFDVTMIEIGQYHQSWPDWHIGPEQAVRAHQWVNGRVMLPVHWALLTLAYHGWTEPVERVLAEGKQQGVTILTPKPGQSIEPKAALALSRWWPEVPWIGADQQPIISTQTN